MIIKKIEALLNEYTIFMLIVLVVALVKYNIITIQFNYFIFTLLLILSILIIEKILREFTYLKKLNLKSTADSTMNPTPGKSMLDSITKQGYDYDDIKEIYLMSYSLKHQYLIKSEFANIMKEKTFKLNIFSGHSATKDINLIKKSYKNVDITILDYYLTEHYNIIIMNDDSALIWYEPSHIVKNQNDILTNGGYLFVVKDIEDSKNKFFEIIENQKLDKSA